MGPKSRLRFNGTGWSLGSLLFNASNAILITNAGKDPLLCIESDTHSCLPLRAVSEDVTRSKMSGFHSQESTQLLQSCHRVEVSASIHLLGKDPHRDWVGPLESALV